MADVDSNREAERWLEFMIELVARCESRPAPELLINAIRFPLDAIAVSIRSESPPVRELAAQLRDISTRGMRIESSELLSEGDIVIVKVPHPIGAPNVWRMRVASAGAPSAGRSLAELERVAGDPHSLG